MTPAAAHGQASAFLEDPHFTGGYPVTAIEPTDLARAGFVEPLSHVAGLGAERTQVGAGGAA